jgi:hypothetical protein
MKNQVQLITYVDCMSGGGLKGLNGLLRGSLGSVLGGSQTRSQMLEEALQKTLK